MGQLADKNRGMEDVMSPNIWPRHRRYVVISLRSAAQAGFLFQKNLASVFFPVSSVLIGYDIIKLIKTTKSDREK